MEIIENKELCYIIDNDWRKYYKECSLNELQRARKEKMDIMCWNEVLTHYDVKKYWKADISDIFIYFVLPKYPKFIQDKFKTTVNNMSIEKRNKLTYEQIKNAVNRWVEEEKYYS